MTHGSVRKFPGMAIKTSTVSDRQRVREFLRVLRATARAMKSGKRPKEKIRLKMKTRYDSNGASLHVRVEVTSGTSTTT